MRLKDNLSFYIGQAPKPKTYFGNYPGVSEGLTNWQDGTRQDEDSQEGCEGDH